MPTLQAKKDNALEVKKQLMKDTIGKEFVPQPHDWDTIELIISSQLQDELDRKLIIADDLKVRPYGWQSSRVKNLSARTALSSAVWLNPF